MKRLWDTEELAKCWSLSYRELELKSSKPGKSHLGLYAQLKYYQNTGQFPYRSSDIPGAALQYLCDQLDTEASELDDYDWLGRTGRRHRVEILAFLGIRRVKKSDKDAAAEWLITQLSRHNGENEEWESRLAMWFHQNHIEFPSQKEVDRLINHAISEFERRLFQQITESLSPEAKEKLSGLVADSADSISYTELKSEPGRMSLDSVLSESKKLRFLNSLNLNHQLLGNLNPKIVARYRQRISAENAWEVRRHQDPAMYAMLTMFCFSRQREVIDGLIELFCQIVHRLNARAEKKVVKAMLKDFQKVYGKNTLLFKIAEASLENPDSQVQDVIYPIAGQTTLANLVKEFKSSGPGYKKQVHTLIRSSYGSHYRRMLPKLLDLLLFKSNNQTHRPVLDALEWISEHRESKQQYLILNDRIPIDGVVKPKWRDVVIEKHGKTLRINRINYEICVLQALRDRLRCKEIWVEGADKYRNPDEDLPQDFDNNRDNYYQDLGHTKDASEFISTIKKQMTEALTSLNQTLPGNKNVRLKTTGKNRITLTPYEPLPEPANIHKIKEAIQERWPMTSLLDVLKESDLRIDFTSRFSSVASKERLSRDEIQRRLLLVLYALGTNAGIKRLADGPHGFGYRELLYARNQYIHKDSLRAAIRDVVNATLQIRNPDIWGEGTTACASDSKKIGAWDANLLTEWHIRYQGRGVMIYWHVEKNSTCIYSQLKRCSSSEVASMIEGVLRHCTDMEVEKQFVDSHGQSEVAFAFCHLLGFDLLPRLKALASQKLSLTGDEQPGEYSNLQPILKSNPINWEVICQQYDEMIKYTAALKHGNAEPEAILRRFTRNNVQHPTYKALSELGKAIKTIFLCRYLQSEALRREIHEGLNVVENWNSANAFIFYGKSGEIATNATKDQEISILALHLLQSCLVYVNTLMIEEVLSNKGLRLELTPEDYRALSPLIYSHINPYGLFPLDMTDRISIAA